MISIQNIIYQFVFKAMTFALSFVFCFSPSASLKGAEPPKVPESFTPSVRFAVCSDIHLSGNDGDENEQKFAGVFDASYAYADSDAKYNELDAVVVCGDFATGGKDSQYVQYDRVSSERLREGTRRLTILGNHEFFEYRNHDPSLTYDAFKRNLGEDVDFHTVINGYHFIGVSYDDNGKTFISKLGWLRQQLDEAVADTGEKPIFVFQHPHPTLSVYGSLYWGCVEMRLLLSKYSQVVDFSGHSHYASSDPRCVWQGAFTAVGTGSVQGFMSNPSYIKENDLPYDSGGFWIVEADEAGSVRLQLYDLVNKCFFEKAECYLNGVSDRSNRPYSWKNRRSLDTAPQFDSGEITLEKQSDGTSVLCFPDAAGYYEAAQYSVTVYSGAAKGVWSGTAQSGYGCAIHSGVTVNVGTIGSGEYRVRVTAYSPYAKRGETITGTVTVN